MKKIIVSVLLVSVFLSASFAWQKTYRSSDGEYVDFLTLKELSQVVCPELTTPVTSSQMLAVLDMMNPDSFTGYARELYDSLYDRLSSPEVVFKYNDVGGNADISVTPFYLYGNVSEKTFSDDDFSVKENKRFNLYDIDADLFITRNFFGKIHVNGTAISGKETDFSDGKMRLAHIFDLSSMSQDWPDQAYGSLGTDNMNLIIGRDRLSAGNGVTGNLYLSENRRFDVFAKFSISKFPISYDFTAVAYDGYKTKTSGTDEVLDMPLTLRTADFSAPRKTVLIHRFSSVLFRKIVLSAYEGAVVYGGDSLSDLQALNPFMFIHNTGTYYSGNTNNFAGLEAGTVFKNGLSANLQIMVDQFQLSGESDESGKTQMGFLANVKGTWAEKNGILTAYAEGVYATDGLYLKENDNSENGYDDNGKTYYFAQTDMISGYKRYANDEKDKYRYIGYPDGGSLIKFAVGSSFRMKDYVFKADLSFAAKGCYGIGVNEERILNREIPSSFKTQYCFILSTSASATFFKGIDCNLTLSSVNFWNYRHVKDLKNNQIQVFLGCKIRPMEFFVSRSAL